MRPPDADAAGEAVGALAELVTATTLADVPEPVVEGARLLLLDSLGALLGGWRYPPVRALAAAVRGVEPAGPGAAPFGVLVPLGAAATWLDADSGGSFHPQGHRLPPVPTAHPAPHALPVLLHEAAARGVPDRRLLEVFLLAGEVGMRFGVASSLRPGLHPHGVHGPAAAAVVAALLRGAPTSEVASAVLLASSLPLAATLAVPVAGGTVRNLWTGLGAWYGACASQWAASGVPAGPGVLPALLDGAVCTDLSPDVLTGGLGTSWQLAQSYLKPYASARWTHPALDALAAATAGQSLRADDVTAVEVETFAFAASLDAPQVDSDLHARFSLPYCVAALLLDGELHAPSFLPDALARPELAALAARVHLREDPAATAALPHERPSQVTVYTREGRSLTARVRNARGNPSSPLSREEVEHKFRRNVGDTVPAPLADALVAGLLDDRRLAGTAVAELARPLVAQLAGAS